VPQDHSQSPPPLEANDQLVTAVITGGWAVALVVLLIVRTSLPPDSRWWIWTCAAGLAMGLFGLWYIPRLKRGRATAAARREASFAGTSTPDGRKWVENDH
jgi:hypothetical protein